MYDTCSLPSINNPPLPPPLCPNITYKFSDLILTFPNELIERI